MIRRVSIAIATTAQALTLSVGCGTAKTNEADNVVSKETPAITSPAKSSSKSVVSASKPKAIFRTLGLLTSMRSNSKDPISCNVIHLGKGLLVAPMHCVKDAHQLNVTWHQTERSVAVVKVGEIRPT